MDRITFPLEGDRWDESRFHVYDNAGRTTWGEIRVRRELKQPDVLIFEIRQTGSGFWKPLFVCTAVGAHLMYRHWFKAAPEKGDTLGILAPDPDDRPVKG